MWIVWNGTLDSGDLDHGGLLMGQVDVVCGGRSMDWSMAILANFEVKVKGGNRYCDAFDPSNGCVGYVGVRGSVWEGVGGREGGGG